jgi:hypothetical protein
VHDHWADNLFCETRFDYGDIESAIKAARHTITREYRMNRQTPMPLEGRGCLATLDKRSDEILVYVSHQLPLPLQIGLSLFLGIPQRRIRVICRMLGVRSDSDLSRGRDRRSRMGALKLGLGAGFRIGTSIWSATPIAATIGTASPAMQIGKLLHRPTRGATPALIPLAMAAGIEASTAPGNIRGLTT